MGTQKKQSRRFFAAIVLTALVASSCGTQEDSRTRNLLDSQGYEVPSAHAYESIYSNPSSGNYRMAGAQESAYATLGPHSTYGKAGSSAASRPSPVYEYEVPAKGGGTTKVAGKPTGAMKASFTSMFSLGSMGGAFAASLAISGIGMGLAALGAPSWLTALFGMGGNEEVMAALRAIQETLKQMNEKLDYIMKSVDAINANVSDLQGAISALSASVCKSELAAQETSFNQAIDIVQSNWNSLFVANKYKNLQTVQFTSEQRAFYESVHKALAGEQMQNSLAIIEGTLMGRMGKPGLISQIQKCTLTENRFLTTRHTNQWNALVSSYILLQAQAMQLLTWDEMYTSSIATPVKEPSATVINNLNAQFQAAAQREGFLVSMQIPEGQMLDTVTNKMWKMGPDGSKNVALIDALKGCIAETDANNYAPLVSWDGTRTVELNKCVASKTEADKPTGDPLDLDPSSRLDNRKVDAFDWRIPSAYELVNPVDERKDPIYKAGGQPGTLGILDAGNNVTNTPFGSWSAKICGPNRNINCPTPSDYIVALGGAQWLSQNDNETIAPIGIVWTNSTLGETGETNTRSGYDNAHVQFNDTTLANSELAKGWNGVSINQVAYVNPDGPTARNPLCGKFIDISCSGATALPLISNDNTKNLNFCSRVTTKILRDDAKETFTMPYFSEVNVVNFGAPATTSGLAKFKTAHSTTFPLPANYRLSQPGEVAQYFTNRRGVNNTSFACAKALGTIKFFEPVFTQLPQTASALWVRNLLNDEVYYSITSESSSTKNISSFLPAVEPPTVTLMAQNGRVNVSSRSPSANYDLMCLVDPTTLPLTPADIVVNGTPCPSTDLVLGAGAHQVFAVASRNISVNQQAQTLFSSMKVIDFMVPEKVSAPPVQNGSSASTEVVRDLSLSAANEAPASGVFTSPQQSAKVASYSLAMLAKRAKLKIQPGSKLKATVAAKSKKVCQASSTAVAGLAVGKCTLTITATSSAGSSKSKLLTISVKQ